jgi:hypothetical protein
VSDAFAEHGFAGASTEAISHAASAKRWAFYHQRSLTRQQSLML